MENIITKRSDKSLKTYFKSLFPWRWFIPASLIGMISVIISMGYQFEAANPPDEEFFRPYIVLWYFGNIFFWFFLDYFFGLGKRGIIFPILIMTKDVELPKGFKNVGISSNIERPVLVADTNDSQNWDELKFPLPSGKWTIKTYKDKGKIKNKIVVIQKFI